MALSKIDVANMVTGLVPNDNTIRRPNATPLIINGDMQVAQRSTSETGKTSAGYYTCDRMHSNIDSIGTYTIIQESLSSGNAYINGFTKAWRIDTTTADASPASGDNFSFIYSFEGQDLQLFKKGTANAEKFTLAFWVKSNKTGTGNVNLFDTDNTRLIGGTYTISSADTWEHKVVNFAADTTGAFTNDNGQSLKIEWFLDSGTNFSSGTTDTAWGSKQDVDRNASGTLQIARNTDNDWAITGIQLEVGEYTSSTLPPFQHESFADNLARCERYYQVVGSGTRADNLTYFSAYNHDGTSTMFGIFNFRTTMRTGPSIDQTSGTNYYTFKCNNATDDFDGVNGFRGGIHAGEFYLSGGSSVGNSSAGEAGKVMGKNASSHIALAAEL